VLSHDRAYARKCSPAQGDPENYGAAVSRATGNGPPIALASGDLGRVEIGSAAGKARHVRGQDHGMEDPRRWRAYQRGHQTAAISRLIAGAYLSRAPTLRPGSPGALPVVWCFLAARSAIYGERVWARLRPLGDAWNARSLAEERDRPA